MTVEEAIEEEETFLVNFDFAIMAIFATYVFDVSTQVGLERKQLQESSYWNKNDKRYNEAIKGVRKASFQAILLALLLIVACAIGFSLPTRNEDQRMVWIVDGISLVFSAAVFANLSFNVGSWTGLYFTIWEPHEQETSSSLKELKFKTRWSYYRIFGRYFFFLLPFYQGVNALTIPLSMVAGIACGLAVDYSVYWARRANEQRMRAIVMFIIFVIMSGASALFGFGVYYIVRVWGQDDRARWEVSFLISIVCSFVVLALLHIARYCISRRKLKSPVASATSDESARNRPRMATSLIVEAMEVGR